MKDMTEDGTIHSFHGIGVKKTLASAQKEIQKVNFILERAEKVHKVKLQRYVSAMGKLNAVKERRKERKESEKEKDEGDEEEGKAVGGAAIKAMKASMSPKAMKAMKKK